MNIGNEHQLFDENEQIYERMEGADHEETKELFIETTEDQQQR